MQCRGGAKSAPRGWPRPCIPLHALWSCSHPPRIAAGEAEELALHHQHHRHPPCPLTQPIGHPPRRPNNPTLHAPSHPHLEGPAFPLHVHTHPQGLLSTPWQLREMRTGKSRCTLPPQCSQSTRSARRHAFTWHHFLGCCGTVNAKLCSSRASCLSSSRSPTIS